MAASGIHILDDVGREPLRAEERRVRRHDLFHDGLIRLRMSGMIWGIHIDMRADNIIPMDMEMVDDVLFHWC